MASCWTQLRRRVLRLNLNPYSLYYQALWVHRTRAYSSQCSFISRFTKIEPLFCHPLEICKHCLPLYLVNLFCPDTKSETGSWNSYWGRTGYWADSSKNNKYSGKWIYIALYTFFFLGLIFFFVTTTALSINESKI